MESGELTGAAAAILGQPACFWKQPDCGGRAGGLSPLLLASALVVFATQQLFEMHGGSGLLF